MNNASKEQVLSGNDLLDYVGRSLVAWPSATVERLALALEGLSACRIGVLTIDRAAPANPSAPLIESVSKELLRLVLDTIDSWLGGIEELAGTTSLSRAAARTLARELAARAGLSGSILEAIVDAHFDGRTDDLGLTLPYERTLPVFAALLARAQHADELVIVVDLETSRMDSQTAMSTESSLRWLGGPGGLKLWACGDGSDALQTFLRGHDEALRDEAAGSPKPEMRRGYLTPPVGLPHPWSKAEQRLEGELARHDWAAGRRWNTPWQANALAAVFRLDVLFHEAACVVEIDGDEHRSAAHYEADRRRDRTLQSHGLRVLRFTNREVLSDAARVAREIKEHVAGAAEASGDREA